MPRKGDVREEAYCPQCNTPRKFAPQRRGDDEFYEVFIRCSACNWESVLRAGPRQIVELEIDVERLEGKLRAGVPVHGVLAARKARLAQLRHELASGG